MYIKWMWQLLSCANFTMSDRRFWETCCLHLNFITPWTPAPSLRRGTMFLQTSLHVRDTVQHYTSENNNIHSSMTLSVLVSFTEFQRNLTSLPSNCPIADFLFFLLWRFVQCPVLAACSFNTLLLQSNVILHTKNRALCWFSGTGFSQSVYTSVFNQSAQKISLCSFKIPWH